MTNEVEAWYLKVRRSQLGEGTRAVLVGDRGRVLLAAEMLEDAEIVNEDRGLTTTIGWFNGKQILVSAFGMGAPIAVIVMHELADLGVSSFVRLGTAMTVGDTELGEFVIATGAVRGESVSSSYLPLNYPAVPDFDLTTALRDVTRDLPQRLGLFATYDGFYTEMFESGHGAETVAERYSQLSRTGVIATDMETSALFVAALALNVKAASCCLASVNGTTNEKMNRMERLQAERTLLRSGFVALTAGADETTDMEVVR